MSDHAEERLTAIFHEHADAVRAYVSTLVPAESVDDVVSDTFLAAWRRIGDVPQAPRGWLIGTARRAASNNRRGARRRLSLVDRLAGRAPQGMAADHTDDSPGADSVRAALAGMSERDRETLVLSAWLDLDNATAAEVLGCTTRTFAVRLHRARARLAEELRSRSDHHHARGTSHG